MGLGKRTWQRSWHEFRRLPTDKDRRIAVREVRRRFYRSRYPWIAIGLVTLVQTPLLALAGWADVARIFIPWFDPAIRASIFSGMVGACVGVVYMLLWRRPLQDITRGYLNEIGYPTCIKCGYNLQGLTEYRCPECGEPFPAEILEDALAQ